MIPAIMKRVNRKFSEFVDDKLFEKENISFTKKTELIGKYLEAKMIGIPTDIEKKMFKKKGSITDLFFIVVGLFIFAFTILISFKIVTDMDTNFQAMSIIPTQAKTISSYIVNFFPNVLDGLFLFLFMGMFIISIILAFLVPTSPVFFFFYLITYPFLIFISAVVSNIYEEMYLSSALNSFATQLPIVHYILQYLPFLIGIFGLVLAIVIYKQIGEAQPS